MRIIILLAFASQALYASPKAVMVLVERGVGAYLCKSPCAIKFESATQNEIAPGKYLWAFSFSLQNKQLKNSAEIAAFIEDLKKTGSYPLDITKEKILAITYFRQEGEKFTRIGLDDFHRLAINPASKVVARFSTEYLLSGRTIAYTLPDLWKTDGLAAATTSVMTIKIPHAISIEPMTLDDQPFNSVEIKHLASETYEIKAKRNLKSDQPAFMLVVRALDTKDPILRLAIPFKPQPNRFLFGVVGFLFGGLIAVMVIVGKRSKV